MEYILFLLIYFAVTLGIFLLVGTFGFLLFHGLLSDAPFIPSGRKKRARMFEYARILPGEEVIDLGSGDGTILIEAAKRGAYAIGAESNPLLRRYSLLRARWNKLDARVVVAHTDLFSLPLSQADVIFLYLFPNAIERLKEKFENESKDGARIISNTFPIPGWTPEKNQDGVFLYRVHSRNSQNK